MKTYPITTNPGKGRGLGSWTLAALLLPLLSLTGVAQAQVTNVIYQDNFARVGLLNGSAPDTVDATGAKWLALAGPTNVITDGSEAAITNVFSGPPYPNAYLPLTIETGHVYTVTASILVNPNYGANWIWLGDAVAPGFNADENSASVGAAWLLQRSTTNAPSGFETFAGPGTGNFSPSITNYIAGFVTNSIVLNTVTNPTKWTISFYRNGVFATNYTFGSVPTAENGTWIQFVGFGASGADGDIQNFSVVDVVPAPTAPVIVEQPNNLTGQVGQTTTFWVGATGLPDPAYQWMTNNGSGWVNITGATNATYTTPPLSMAYNGLNYSVTASTAAGSTPSAAATLTVVAGQPTIFSAMKTASLTNVVVMFSGPVDPVTSQTAANYSLNINGIPSGVSVLSASFGSASNNIVLTTSTLNPNAGYTLGVQNVQDLFGDVMTSASVPVLPSGLVFYVRGDSGVALDGNGNAVEWLDQTTNGNNAVQFFGMSLFTSGLSVPGPQARPNTSTTIGPNNEPALTFNNGSDNFLTAAFSPSLTINNNLSIYAVANPSTTSPTKDLINETMGNQPGSFDYQLSAAGDQSMLRGFGTGNGSVGAVGSYPAGTPHVYAVTSFITGTNSAGAVTNLIQHYIDGVNNNGTTSNAIPALPGNLDCEQPLYIGWREDHYASAIMNGQIGEIMLFNTALSGADRTNVDNYLGQKYFPFTITQDLPATLTTTNGFAVTYFFGATVGSAHGLSFQWQENGTNIPGATGSSYTTPILAPSNNGETFDVLLTLPNGSTTNSTTNTLTVLGAPPAVIYAGITIWSPTNVVVLFDEAVSPSTASVAANYSLNNGATIRSAAIGDMPGKVVLTTSALTWDPNNPGSYSLTVSNVQDLFGFTMVTASTTVGLYPNAALWVIANTGVTSDGNGGAVQWNDLSGNGNTLFGFGGSTDPLLATNNYGDTVLRFADTNHSQMYAYNANSLGITGDMSVFSVINFATLAGGTNGEIVSKTGSGSHANIAAPYDYYMATAGGPFYRGNGGGSGNGVSYGQYTSTNGPSVGVPHILGVTELGNTVSHFIDGNAAGTGILSDGYNETNDIDQGQTLFIGERGDGINGLSGDLAEMIVVSSGGMSSNDISLLDNYLSLNHRLPIGTNSYAIITQQPVASTNVGLNATLIVPVGVSGNPLALQWYDTGGAAIAGQTSPTLTINNDQTNDMYYLVATNVFGSATSSVVSVTVVSGEPQIYTQPQTSYGSLGNAVSLYVGADGTAPLAYQWQFLNGSSWVNLADNGRIVGSQSATLNITNMLESDQGGYQVIVTNLSGSVTSSVADLFIIGHLPITFANGVSWFSPATSDAKFANNVLVLTTNGLGQSSYFFEIPQYIGAFEASFTYQAGYATTVPLADGAAFVVQDDPRGASAIGSAGGSLCVAGISPSVELELNLYPGNGVGGVGYSVDTDGAIGPVVGTGAINLTNAVANDGPGDPITININYANGYMSLTFTDLVAATSFGANLYIGSIASILGTNTAYIGFTAAFGADTSVQTITNFSFISIPAANAQLNSGANVVVSWPGSINGYTLQQNSSLVTTNWLNVTNQAILTNGLNEVIIPSGGNNMFYRLILP